MAGNGCAKIELRMKLNRGLKRRRSNLIRLSLFHANAGLNSLRKRCGS